MANAYENDEVLKKFYENQKKLEKNKGKYPKSKEVYISDLPRKYKLSEEEKEKVKIKYPKYIWLQEKAILIVKKHINRLKRNNEYQLTVENLKNGLNVLEVGLTKDVEDGQEGIIAVLERFPRNRRPGFGLSRGFGEFLWKGEEWEIEILDAVDAIEDYYRNM